MSKGDLHNSLHQAADHFYEFILKNDIASDDFDFGTYDHFWISAMLAAWLSVFKQRAESPEGGFINSLFDSAEQQSEVHQKLCDGFLAAAKGNIVPDTVKFTELMDLFKKYYGTLWD